MIATRTLGTLVLALSMVLSAPGLARSDRGCLVRMLDPRNDLNVLLESRSERADKRATRYIITRNLDARSPESIDIIVPSNWSDPIQVDVGVPPTNLREIRREFPLGQLLRNGYEKEGRQLTWIIESAPWTCRKNDVSLIHFMVWEWFYFG